MAALDDPMAQVTRLPNLAFVDDHDNRYRALNTPILSQQEIVDIPVTENLVGGIVFNKNTEELETYTAAGFWLPILTAESDINVETLTAQTVNAINADLTHIHSNDITNDAVITTLGLLTTGDAQVNGTLHVQTNATVDGSATVNSLVVNNNALMDGLVVNNSAVIQENLLVDGTANFQTGGVSGNFGVNGNLTAGNLATIGTFQADGASTLQDVTINGDLTVNGFGIFQALNATNINALDIGANSIQPEALLYSLTNLGGGAPITATLDIGAGTGATCTITGSNVAGIINIHTGTSPALGVIATFALPSSLSSLMTGQGAMIMTPASITTAMYEQSSKTYVSSGANTNIIGLFGSSQTALAASTTYVWNYVIIGNQLGT
jgi:hypothetical protein